MLTRFHDLLELPVEYRPDEDNKRACRERDRRLRRSLRAARDQSAITLLGNVGHRGSTISTGPPVLPAAARSIPAAAAGVAAITFAAGHFVKLVNPEFVDFNVQIGHVTLLFLGRATPSRTVDAGLPPCRSLTV